MSNEKIEVIFDLNGGSKEIRVLGPRDFKSLKRTWLREKVHKFIMDLEKKGFDVNFTDNCRDNDPTVKSDNIK